VRYDINHFSYTYEPNEHRVDWNDGSTHLVSLLGISFIQRTGKLYRFGIWWHTEDEPATEARKMKFCKKLLLKYVDSNMELYR
jgi:hypothetical protein